MNAFVVRRSGPLAGTVRVSGAKNSALKLLAAALLSPGRTVVRNVPAIADLDAMADVLRHLDVAVTRDGGAVVLDVPDALGCEAPESAVRRLRASIVVLGPLLARCRRARVALPGGCDLGSRSIDMHLAGLARLGAEITYTETHVEARAPRGRLEGADIDLPYASVGATENLLMAAVTARGTTRITNAAREPEIGDLARMLVAMGARIDGVGTSELRITGVDALAPVDHEVVGDRIEAGTYAVAAALTGGQVVIDGVDPGHLRLPLDKLRQAGVAVELAEQAVTVAGSGALHPVDVVTLPYPGFPTDLQPQLLVLLSQASGTSMLTENVFDGRFSIVAELARMGADVAIEGHHAVVRGPTPLRGTTVRATDLRAGAALVLAGLVAEGETVVTDAHHIDRGYADLAGKLRALGADTSRQTDVVAAGAS
jgi:UDP-N-acetylglucosamine 1-carboxyvinyltransferase